METLGIIREKSWERELVTLYSESLKLSVPTKIILCCASSVFDFISTPVKTGEKLFSVIAYSTFSIPFEKIIVSSIKVLSWGTSGRATYSEAGIPLISKVSFEVLIVITVVFWSTENSTVSLSIVLRISRKVLALTVTAPSIWTAQGSSSSTYFSISVALINKVSIDALR